MFTLMLLLTVNWCLTLSPSQIPLPELSTFGHENFEISFIPTPQELGPMSILRWHYTHGFTLSSKRGSYHIILSLLLSGQVEPNPGPGRPPKYPCGECHKAVRWGRSIACDRCDQWFHKECLDMKTVNFEANKELSWSCCNCAFSNFSGLFDSSDSLLASPRPTINSSIDSSPNSSIDSPPGRPTHQSSPVAPNKAPAASKRKKNSVRNLKIEVINFDSILAKKNVLEQSLNDDQIDIVIGCESKLSSDIFDNEILPNNYECWRNDRDRHGDGVIIIFKSNLKVEPVY